MDELTLLRGLDADTPAPTRAALESAFDALTDRMAAAEQTTRPHVPTDRRRRTARLRRAAIVTAGAAALGATLVLTDVVGIAGLRPGATAQAAELLDRAASVTIHTADPVLRPGDYRRVVFTSVHDVNVDGDTGNRRADILIHEDYTTWIPAEADKPWVQVRYSGLSAGSFGGAEGTHAAARWNVEAKKEKAEVLRGVNGNFFGDNDLPTPASVAALPRDPRILLNHIYRVTIGGGPSADGEALVFIADTLDTGLPDAATRAALYRAAALIPGVTRTAGSATLDGHTGVAIGRTEPSTGIRQDLIIDPDTGALIGERDVATRSINSIPAGATISWTSADATIVDAVPAEYRG